MSFYCSITFIPLCIRLNSKGTYRQLQWYLLTRPCVSLPPLKASVGGYSILMLCLNPVFITHMISHLNIFFSQFSLVIFSCLHPLPADAQDHNIAHRRGFCMKLVKLLLARKHLICVASSTCSAFESLQVIRR